MKEQIIKALKENSLFEGSISDVAINKEKEFFSRYQLNNSKNNPIDKMIERNKHGLLDFTNAPFIISDIRPSGHNFGFWLLLANGSRVFCKKINNDEASMELLVEKFLNKIKMPHALYDKAILADSEYLITQSFLTPEEYLFDYYNQEDFKDILTLLSKASEINQESYMMKTMLIDFIINNKDRFPFNAKTIIDKSYVKICPLFDNGLACLADKYKKNSIIPSFQGNNSFDDIMSYLLSDNKLLKWFLISMSNLKVENYQEEIKKEKGIYVDKNMDELFKTTVNENLSKVKCIIKNL